MIEPAPPIEPWHVWTSPVRVALKEAIRLHTLRGQKLCPGCAEPCGQCHEEAFD